VHAGTALNANQLESIAAVGPRLSLFHKDSCGNASWESTYIYSGGFVSERSLPPSVAGYLTAPPGIYGNDSPPVNSLDAASARLTSSLQSAELNRRWGWGSCTQFLAGFRWLQWQENLAVSDVYAASTPSFGQDVYTTGCYNNLFGGQIGLDTALWQPSKHFRLEGLVKAGAYYNSAYQSSSYQNYVGGVPVSGEFRLGRQFASRLLLRGRAGADGRRPDLLQRRLPVWLLRPLAVVAGPADQPAQQPARDAPAHPDLQLPDDQRQRGPPRVVAGAGRPLVASRPCLSCLAGPTAPPPLANSANQPKNTEYDGVRGGSVRRGVSIGVALGQAK
jgi:hypothetical protein